MGIVECAFAQTWQSIQIQDFFEITDFVSCQVDGAERYQTIKTNANLFYIIPREIKMFQSLQVCKTLDVVNLVAVKPKFLNHYTLLETTRLLDSVPAQKDFSYISELIETFNGIQEVMGDPNFLKVLAAIKTFNLLDTLVDEYQLLQIDEV